MNETVGCRNDVYTGIGVGAVRGEAEKRQSRDEALLRRAEFASAGVEFAPSCLEASGVRGQPSPLAGGPSPPLRSVESTDRGKYVENRPI